MAKVHGVTLYVITGFQRPWNAWRLQCGR